MENAKVQMIGKKRNHLDDSNFLQHVEFSQNKECQEAEQDLPKQSTKTYHSCACLRELKTCENCLKPVECICGIKNMKKKCTCGLGFLVYQLLPETAAQHASLRSRINGIESISKKYCKKYSKPCISCSKSNYIKDEYLKFFSFTELKLYLIYTFSKPSSGVLSLDSAEFLRNKSFFLNNMHAIKAKEKAHIIVCKLCFLQFLFQENGLESISNLLIQKGFLKFGSARELTKRLALNGNPNTFPKNLQNVNEAKCSPSSEEVGEMSTLYSQLLKSYSKIEKFMSLFGQFYAFENERIKTEFVNNFGWKAYYKFLEIVMSVHNQSV